MELSQNCSDFQTFEDNGLEEGRDRSLAFNTVNEKYEGSGNKYSIVGIKLGKTNTQISQIV